MKTVQLINLAFKHYPVDTVIVEGSTWQLPYKVDRNEVARKAFLDGFKRGKANSKGIEAKTVEVLLDFLKDIDAAKPLHPMREGSRYLFKEDYDRAYNKWARKRKKLAQVIPDLKA